MALKCNALMLREKSKATLSKWEGLDSLLCWFIGRCISAEEILLEQNAASHCQHS